MLAAIKKAVDYFRTIAKEPITIVSHYDTDGITAASILSKAFQREDLKFHVKIIKQLERELIEEFKNDEKIKTIFFLDLGSGGLEYIKEMKSNVFILDHHELSYEDSLPENIKLINPHYFKEEIEMSAASVVYLFAKELNIENKELANLAILGMVGDMAEKVLSRINNNILKDSEVIVKRGLLLFSSTRPIARSLEYSSEFFIPGVTGSSTGVSNLLRSLGIDRQKIILDLTEEETSKLVTAIMLGTIGQERAKDIVGNIYLLKFFNKIEDARELSTLINACSRLGYSDVALSLCLGSNKAKIKAESIYNTYKHELIASLKWVEANEKIENENYVIINAKNNIKDTIIGTVTSILASSLVYKEGTVVVGMAYRGDKIKVSMRNSRNGRLNLQNFLENINKVVTCEFGGHANAAGCVVEKEKENEFIEAIKRDLENECLKIKMQIN